MNFIGHLRVSFLPELEFTHFRAAIYHGRASSWKTFCCSLDYFGTCNPIWSIVAIFFFIFTFVPLVHAFMEYFVVVALSVMFLLKFKFNILHSFSLCVFNF